MVKVLFQNNRNWASYKCLVRKSVKMCLPQHFSKDWDVEFRKWHFLQCYMPEFHIYVSIHGNNTFPGGGMISKKVGIYLSQMHERKLKIG